MLAGNINIKTVLLTITILDVQMTFEKLTQIYYYHSPLNSQRQKAIASKVASEHRHFGGQKIPSDNFALNPCIANT